jgi:glycerophosphoryl diester phosphodiesterase
MDDGMRIMQQHGISWQAHRGGGGCERPDNTLASARYAWALGGIPEFDVRTTLDGVIVCLHDPTLARTTTAPEPVRSRKVSELLWLDVRTWDAGLPFAPIYVGERVPALADVFADMRGRPERCAYLDLKSVDLRQLAEMIEKYGIGEQLIVCSPNREQCEELRGFAPGVRTMQWIGGSREAILAAFCASADTGFAGLDQVQLHLNDADGDWPWEITPEDLVRAMETSASAGVDLEVLPWHFDESGIHRLLDLGVRWFATDEPGRFTDAVLNWIPEKEGRVPVEAEA